MSGGVRFLSHESQALAALTNLEISGQANGHLASSLVRDVVKRPILSAELMGTVRLLARLKAAEDAVEKAEADLAAARRDLAEVVGTKPEGKDAGFEADYEAKQRIVAAVLEAVAEADLRRERINGTGSEASR